jgi:hypothetical protein
MFPLPAFSLPAVLFPVHIVSLRVWLCYPSSVGFRRFASASNSLHRSASAGHSKKLVTGGRAAPSWAKRRLALLESGESFTTHGYHD